MSINLEPLKTENLTELFIEKFEELIISGAFPVGEKLPSERELAVKLGVSRPVVHEGLLDLEYKGLVRVIPRTGTVINDFRKTGSLTLLNSLVKYHDRGLEPGLLKSLLDVRMLFETENARLASVNRTDEDVKELNRIILAENSCRKNDVDLIVKTDFDFHLSIALAGGNSVYPMLLNSFRTVYTTLTGEFYKLPGVIDEVFPLHKKITEAVEAKNPVKSSKLMNKLLKHGEEKLLSTYK